MRIWHKALLSALPDKKLLEQWHDVCAVARNVDVIGTLIDCVVNPVMEYPLSHLYSYAMLVIEEMDKRGFAVSSVSYANFEKHIFSAMEKTGNVLEDISYELMFYNWHNDKYLWQCCSILEEKYDRHDITYDEWQVIEKIASLYTYPIEEGI